MTNSHETITSLANTTTLDDAITVVKIKYPKAN